MLRSEEVDCISMYCSSTGLRNIVERLGDASIIQIKGDNKPNGNFDSEIKTIEAVEQKLNYLRNEMRTIEDNEEVNPAIKQGPSHNLSSFIDKANHNNENQKTADPSKLTDQEDPVSAYKDDLLPIGEFNPVSILQNMSRNETMPMNSNDGEDMRMIDSSKSKALTIETKLNIQKYHKRLVQLKTDLKVHKKKEEILEQNLKMIEISKSFAGHITENENSTVIDFDFITAISETTDKFVIKKMIKHKLRRNAYINTVEYKKYTVFIIYVIGPECKEYVERMIESLGGRVFDCSNKYLEGPCTISTNGVPVENNTLCDLTGSDMDRKPINDNSLNNMLASDDSLVNPTDRNTSNDSVNNLDDGKNLKQSAINDLRREYKELKKLNRCSKEQINSFLKTVQSNFSAWEYTINKEKRILTIMNNLVHVDGTDCYSGEGWILRKDLSRLCQLKSFDTPKGRFIFQIIKDQSQKPTHFESTEFTRAFQNLTNVFGVPRYREINPAIFMVFTFPFLFGAMFGDVLHGLILLFISLYMVFRFNKLDGNCGVLQLILDGRYVVMTCSFAAIWFGFLYGDFGSLPITLFRSQFEVNRTYPFGIDPSWHHATNKMVFINSLKMKLSLIIGFAHVGLGSLISIANSVFFNDKMTLICIAIPQAIAFFLFLGYLVFLCLYKWLVTIDHPSLVNTLISMYTDPFNMRNQMYPGQLYVQLFIFSTILVCIPWMFLSKPVYLISRRRVPEDGMLDLWINSGIHVVEFCLGLISNTSSYLRLWAVSLAHVQLTTVLHEFTLGNSSWLVKILTFPIYVSATFMLLIGLEGLSSCLHALRLNWIEFFSKFYGGCGEVFEPFNFSIPKDGE